MGTFLRGTLRIFSMAMGAAALAWAQQELTINPTTLPYAGVGQGYSITLDAFGGNGPFTWSVNASAPGSLPAGISLSPNGVLSGTPAAPGVSTVQVDVLMSNPTARGTATLNIVVVEVAGNGSLGSTPVGTAFSTQLGVSANVQGVVWARIAGNLPPGLSVSNAGVVSGTPTQAGAYDFTVRATIPNILNQAPVIATKSFSMQITAAPATGGTETGTGAGASTGTGTGTGTGAGTGTGTGTGASTGTGAGTGTSTGADTPPPAGGDGSASLTITTASLPNAAYGQPFSTQLTAFGGLGTYVWAADSTPPGLTLSPTGLLSGTPTDYGLFLVKFSVTAGAETVSHPGIIMAIVRVLPGELSEGEVASPYSQTFSVSFFTPTWLPVAGTLPSGLTFDNGLLSGTLTASGTFTFTITASITTLLGTVVVPQQYTVKVNPTTPVVISAGPLPYAGIGQLYRAQLQAEGGNGEFSWSAVGPMPPGLTMGADGFINGKPTQAGTFSLAVRVNSARVQGTAQLAIVVIDILNGSPLAPAQATARYSNQLAVTTGFADWSIVSGMLPPGFSLSSQGFLQGTSSVQGTFAFRVRATIANIVTDSAAVSAERDFVLEVGPPPLSIGTQVLGDGRVQDLYTQEMQVTGGKPPYQLSLIGGPNWLGVGGTSLSGVPPAIGEFGVTVSVTDAAAGHVTRSYSLNITPLGPLSPKLVISPSILRYSIPAGGELSLPQNLTVVSSTADAVSFTLETPGASWLRVDGVEGKTPRALSVRATSAGLQAGDYSGSLRLTADGQIPINIPVLLTVKPVALRIEAAPVVLRFTTSLGTPRVLERLLVLENRGGGPSINFNTVIVNSSRWISAVAPSPAIIGNGSTSYVRVRVDTQGLAAGAYRETIRVASLAGAVDVPVSLFVSDSGLALDVNARGVLLAARAGQGSNPKQTVKIRNSGDAGGTLNWTAEIVRGSNLFTLTPPSGAASLSDPSTLEIGLKPGVADTAGVNSAIIRLTDPRAQQSPRYVVAVSQIDSKVKPSSPLLTPAGVLFFGRQNGASPAAKSVEVSVSNAEPVRFTAAATSDGSGDWLGVQPTEGTLVPGLPAVLQVSATTGRLAPGVHRGRVHVAIGSELRSVLVTFVVGPAVPTILEYSGGVRTRPEADPCVPGRTAISQTALPGNFAVPAGWPAALTVQLADDCGAPLVNGSVVAHFSNGDAPLVLDGDGSTGEYTATWQPGVVDAQTTVSLEAAAGALAPAKMEITGAVVANPALPPAVVEAGLVNNLSGQIGGALAPGTVTQVNGSNFSIYTSRPGSTPLPTLMLGVEAIIGGLSSPIYYLSPNQLGIQVPSELAPNKTYSAIVAVRDAYSLPQMVDVAPVQPGVSTTGGILVANHSDGTPVTADHPATPGEEIAAFLVGMGATSPAVPSGNAAPSSPLALVVNQARVAVNGQSATTILQDLVPGQVGLYRVSFRVPFSVQPGLADVVISQNGIASNTGKLAIAAQ